MLPPGTTGERAFGCIPRIPASIVIARSMALKPCDVAISRYNVMIYTIHRLFFRINPASREIATA